MTLNSPKLQAVVESVLDEDREEVLKRLAGPYPPAETLATVLTRAGHPVSATTIRTYRRELARAGRAS